MFADEKIFRIRFFQPDPLHPRSNSFKVMTALDKLKLIAAWDSDPALTEDELEELLAAAALPDGAGVEPEGEGWEPTYDLNHAAAEAWLTKAARSAALVEVDPPGSGIVTSRVFDNCRAMARLYSARRAATTTIGIVG
jgi:hypothetical protein